MRRAFSLHIPPSLRIHRWEGGMQCERLSVCSGHPAAAGALYGAGSGGGLSGASGRRAPHPADALRHGGEEEAYTAIEEDAQSIYKNFNAIVAMLKSNENGTFDKATNNAVKTFLQNIFDADLRILAAYGLV